MSAHVPEPSDPAILSAAATLTIDDLVGREIGRFCLEEKVYADASRGTFFARHTRLNFRAVVRAVDLHAALIAPEHLHAYVQSAHKAIQISRPSIVRVLACETYQHFLLIVTEFTEGVTYAQRLVQEHTVAEEHALLMAQSVAEGLQAGLARGYVHGGVCPTHIRVTANHKTKLVDYCWHIPRAVLSPTGDGADQPTLVYRAPEHLRDAATADQRADICALGASLYHILTGRPPFTASNVRHLLALQEQMTLPAPHTVNPAVSRRTSELVMQMLALDYTQRPSDYSHLLPSLQAALLHARLYHARSTMHHAQVHSAPPPSPTA